MVTGWGGAALGVPPQDCYLGQRSSLLWGLGVVAGVNGLIPYLPQLCCIPHRGGGVHMDGRSPQRTREALIACTPATLGGGGAPSITYPRNTTSTLLALPPTLWLGPRRWPRVGKEEHRSVGEQRLSTHLWTVPRSPRSRRGVQGVGGLADLVLHHVVVHHAVGHRARDRLRRRLRSRSPDWPRGTL